MFYLKRMEGRIWSDREKGKRSVRPQPILLKPTGSRDRADAKSVDMGCCHRKAPCVSVSTQTVSVSTQTVIRGSSCIDEEVIFISNQGEKFHSNRHCFGLRHARTVRELRPCKVCASIGSKKG